MDNAVLPENLETRYLNQLLVGEEVYVVSWAMWVDSQRHCWLHPDYGYTREPFGTSHMKVIRKDDGFWVYASDTNETWGVSDDPEYAGEVTGWLPVVRLL